MTTPGPDPRFPNRPDHPNFWRLSKAVIANDDAADHGVPIETIMANLGVESPESVEYMAEQRVLRALGHNFVSPQAKAMLMGLWIDAFVAGVGFTQQKPDTDTP
jgi:hypothetical protein